jgi:heme A synthase
VPRVSRFEKYNNKGEFMFSKILNWANRILSIMVAFVWIYICVNYFCTQKIETMVIWVSLIITIITTIETVIKSFKDK